MSSAGYSPSVLRLVENMNDYDLYDVLADLAYVDEVFRGSASASWEMRTLGDVVQGLGQYGTSQRSNADDQGLPVLGMPHIHRGRIRWEKVSTVDLPPSEVRKYELAYGDVLFNRTNSAELVGKTAVFDGSRRAVFASYLIRYRANTERADPHFISAYINSRRGRRVHRTPHGASNRAS